MLIYYNIRLLYVKSHNIITLRHTDAINFKEVIMSMKYEFPEVLDNGATVRDLIKHINLCNDTIDMMSNSKAIAENDLAVLLEHTKIGAHNHTFDDWKITITTGLNYRLNIERYIDSLSAVDNIDDRFPIVKQVTKFELNNKAIRDCEMYGTQQDNAIKDAYLSATPKKLHIKISKVTV